MWYAAGGPSSLCELGPRPPPSYTVLYGIFWEDPVKTAFTGSTCRWRHWRAQAEYTGSPAIYTCVYTLMFWATYVCMPSQAPYNRPPPSHISLQCVPARAAAGRWANLWFPQNDRLDKPLVLDQARHVVTHHIPLIHRACPYAIYSY